MTFTRGGVLLFFLGAFIPMAFSRLGNNPNRMMGTHLKFDGLRASIPSGLSAELQLNYEMSFLNAMSEEEGAYFIAGLIEKIPEALACAGRSSDQTQELLWKLALYLNHFSKKSEHIHSSGIQAHTYNSLNKFCASQAELNKEEKRSSDSVALCRDILWSRISPYLREAAELGDKANLDASYTVDSLNGALSEPTQLQQITSALLKGSDQNPRGNLQVIDEVNSYVDPGEKQNPLIKCQSDVGTLSFQHIKETVAKNPKDFDWRLLFPEYNFPIGLLFADPKLSPDWAKEQYKVFKDQGIGKDALVDALVGYQNVTGEQVAARKLELPRPHQSKTTGDWVDAVKIAVPNKMISVDGSISSTQPRVFALDFSTGKIDFALKTSHGGGRGKLKNSNEEEKYVSDTNNSNLTPPPGDYVMTEHFYSLKTAQSIVVAGLDAENGGTVHRGVWWHSDKERKIGSRLIKKEAVTQQVGESCYNSQGCRVFDTEDLSKVYAFRGFEWDEKSGAFSRKKGGDPNEGLYIRVFNPTAVNVSVTRK